MKKESQPPVCGFRPAVYSPQTAVGGLGALAYNHRPTAYHVAPLRGKWPLDCRRGSLQSGFSLIEVTLAMLVLAVGILGILVLFPAGLQQNERSIADTRAAFLAEEVFGGLRARAEADWADLDEFNLPVAAANLWSLGTNVFMTGPKIVATNIYRSGSYEDHALRYSLVVTNVGVGGLLKSATLFVWPGEFGTINDPSVFYTEFFRFSP